MKKANTGICIIQDEIIKYVDNHFLKMSGYEEKEIIGKSFAHLIASEEKLQKYHKRMKNKFYETVLIGKDGRRIYVEVTATIIDYKNRPAELVIVRNIMEKKKMEKALKESEEKLRSFLEATRDGVIITDENGKIIF